MSTARNDKFKVDAAKLKKLLDEKHISMGDASKKVGHDRSWLSQRMKKKEKEGKKEEFEISGEDANLLATALSCGIQDFKTEDEETYSPLIFDSSLLQENIAKMRSDLFPLVTKFLNFIVNADDQEIVNVYKFLESATPQIKKSCSVDPDYWFQEFLLTETSDVFYEKLADNLEKKQIVKSEADLRELVLSERSKTAPMHHQEAIKRVRTRLRKDMRELEDVLDDTLNDVLENSAQFLMSYFNGEDSKAERQVNAIKNRLREST